MKYLAILCSLYMIIIALMPCQDRAESMADMQSFPSVQNHAGVPDHCNQDACPPFCACSCCSTARHFPANAVPAFLGGSTAHSYPGYPMPGIQKPDIAIWQPPQIG